MCNTEVHVASDTELDSDYLDVMYVVRVVVGQFTTGETTDNTCSETTDNTCSTVLDWLLHIYL